MSEQQSKPGPDLANLLVDAFTTTTIAESEAEIVREAEAALKIAQEKYAKAVAQATKYCSALNAAAGYPDVITFDGKDYKIARDHLRGVCHNIFGDGLVKVKRVVVETPPSPVEDRPVSGAGDADPKAQSPDPASGG